MTKIPVILLVLLAGIDTRAEDCERVAVWQAGKQVATVCRADVESSRWTVLDLGEDWVPSPLAPGQDTPAPGYAATYLALAQERFADAGLDGILAKRDRYLELFGVVPSFGVIHARLADDTRHACHSAIDDTALASWTDTIAVESAADGRQRISRARALRAELERDRVRKKAVDLEALAGLDAGHRRALDRLTALEHRIEAVRAIQAHLVCDGLTASAADGIYASQTRRAIQAFQRGAMILPSGITDAPTREALLLDSRERDLRAALRVLRERVADARGLVEDGTAADGEGTVLGRSLVPDATWRADNQDPLPDAAVDLISPATEAAARALGWRDATSIRASLDALLSPELGTHLVAVELPALPAYHGADMALSVEIDRGDVWRSSSPRPGEPTRRPTFVLYTTIGERRIALVRWRTTIGGWQNENVDGDIKRRWKESPAGPRIWRDLYIGPSWLPPASTPDDELVRRGAGDRAYLAREQMGPSYRAAFGLVAFVHVEEQQVRDTVEYADEGIRTHGTGNLVSLGSGVSHGCHRLLGYHVVRLASFVLGHRAYIRHGDTPTYYRRVVRVGTSRLPLAIDTLGYRIELDPPIPIEVLPGRFRR